MMHNDNHATQDYEHLRNVAFFARIVSRLRRRRTQLYDFNQVGQFFPLWQQHDKGIQSVPIEKIVGSVGRSRDFDRQFRPTQEVTRWRWVQVAEAFFKGSDLPAVDLVKVGSLYFVQDGHHRISVLNYRGAGVY